jgi:hypothetical protein
MPTQKKRPLKNYTARLTTKPLETIQEELAHHASSVQFYYKDGQAIALNFSMQLHGHEVSFRLPARVREVEIRLYGKGSLSATQKKQAYVTAWANIRDWVISQIAMIETGMVKPEEVFLPYMLNQENLTLFEAMEQRQFLLESGEK